LYFKVERLSKEFAMSTSDSVTAVSNFTVNLPPHPYPELVPGSSFGINTAFEPGQTDIEERLRLMREAGIKWGRQDFVWRYVEPSPGSYNWSFCDQMLEMAQRYGVSLLINLAYEPNWVNIDSRDAVDAYARFARAAVERYRDSIKFWQIWNEPNGGFWNSTPGQYARFLVAASKAIHEADPQAKVVGLNMAFCDIQWAERMFRLIPRDSFDILAFHPYRPPNDPEERLDLWMRDHLRSDDPLVHQDFPGNLEAIRRVMEFRGAVKPIWITEICWTTQIHPYGTNELRQADLLVRFYVLAIANRVEKVFWWTLSDEGTRQFDQADMVGLCRFDLSPKYSYYAYAWMTRLLEGKRFVGMPVRSRSTYAAVFTDGEQDTVVAWTTRPYSYIRVSFSQQLVFHDIFGTRRMVPSEQRTKVLSVPLSPSPIYITAPSGIQIQYAPEPGW
jgi:hypothetical protein